MCENDGSIKIALCEVVTALMSPDPNERILAEHQIDALQVTEEYGVALTELTLEHDGLLQIRQMTALLLKQYVDTHWSSLGEKFKGPETSPAAKVTIKNMLPHGLKESISKVRNSVAYTISTIASWDWPDHWPELFDILMGLLKENNEFAVQGSVRVLKEFVRDLGDSQISNVAPVILPDMYRIFMEKEQYSVRTRSRAIEIFNTLATMICTMAETDKSLFKAILGPILPYFTEALVTGLSIPDDSHFTDTGLKMAVLKALTVLVKNVPKTMSSWISQILPPVWSTMTSSADKYVKNVVNDTGDEEEIVDSDGEVLGFENLVFAIFEFVHALVESPKFRVAVKSGLSDLMYYIVLYMQITHEQCDKWSQNPDLFVEDEDEDSFSYSVRISAQDLLMALCEEFEQECSASLAQSIQRHLSEADQAKASGNENWWKAHEAAMLALGSVHEVIEGQIEEGKVDFDIKGFLENVVLNDAANPASPFLLGRCLWIGSKFPSRISNPAMTRFVEATVSGLTADKPTIVRISAVRAIWGFSQYLRASKNRTLLTPFLPAVTDALINMCGAFNSSSEVLGLILQNLSLVLACDISFAASYESKVTPLIIAIFIKFSSDHVLTSLIEDIFKVIATSTPECAASLESRLIPTLVSILDAEGDKVSTGLQAVALDILQTLVRANSGNKENQNQPRPLSQLLVANAFPAAVRCTLHSDDNSVTQSGGECLRAYVSVGPDQICHFTDAEGKSGLWYMVQVAGHLLNPVGSEFSATFVGRLVTTLIQKTGDRLGENLDHLLKAVLSKLRGSETLSVIQSLIMVYAQLVHTQLPAVLNFLCSVPGPSGELALHFVMTEWVSRQHLFYGSYEKKVSVVALAKLLQHGVNNNDTRLQEINVKGDHIINEASRTRSQKKVNPDQWTNIPLLVKIFKLLVGDLSDHLENALASAQDDHNDIDSGAEETDEEWEDDDSTEMNSTGRTFKQTELSRLLGLNGTFDDEEDGEDEEDDPDALADPLYRINLRQYLTEFVGEFTKQPYFMSHFGQHLNAMEKKALASIGIQA